MTNADRRPSPEEVRAALRYDPETGKLFWRHRADMRPQWNGRYAGKEAFTAIDSHGYRHGNINNHHTRAHRIIWVLLHGRWPFGVDHEDQNRLRNVAGNLREADHPINSKNMKMYASNTSGVTGASLDKRSGRWAAYIGRGSRHLGCFASFDAAVAARRKAEKERGYHPNHGK